MIRHKTMIFNKHFIFFIVVSVSIHAILLIHFNSENDKVLLPASTGNILTINIKEKINKKDSHHKNKLSLANKQPADKRYTSLINNAAMITHAEPIKIKEQLSSEISNDAQINPDIKMTQARVLSLLKTKLRQNFYYPKLAQRRNWQGNVLLIFDVNSKGSIKNVAVKQSSGYIILDNAAVHSLSTVSSLSRQEINANQYSGLKLNVKYQLEEG